MGDREGTLLLQSPSRRTVRCCLKQMSSCDCARRAFSEHGGSSPSTSVLVTWLRQHVAVTLQRAQARAIHARTARLEVSIFGIYTPLAPDYLNWGSHCDCGVFLVFCAPVVFWVESFLVRFYRACFPFE